MILRHFGNHGVEQQVLLSSKMDVVPCFDRFSRRIRRNKSRAGLSSHEAKQRSDDTKVGTKDRQP